jgi:integrase
MAAEQRSKPLSAKAIESMKPNDPVKTDSGENRGLRVICGATGKKTFFYRYNSPLTGKQVQLKIGSYPSTSLAEARVKLVELKANRQEGRCPATEQKLQKQEERRRPELEEQKQAFTVEALCELYLAQYIEDRKTGNGRTVKGARKPKGQAEVRRMLYADVIANIGGKPAADVTRKDVADLIWSILDRGANVQAGSVLRELTAAFDFAIGRGQLDETFPNPALMAKSSLKQSKVRLTSQKGKRVLSDDELAQFLKWLPGSGYSPNLKNVLRLTLWTGCRTGEVCNTAWRDIDLEKGTYHIRESKNDTERFVQLPTQAVEFLASLKLSTADYPFASQRTGLPIQQKQLTEQAWRLRRDGRMLDIAPWTPHDLRRTVRTGLSRLQCPSEVAEAILGHSHGGIEGTYNLHRYDAEAREWLQRWADHLDTLISD